MRSIRIYQLYIYIGLIVITAACLDKDTGPSFEEQLEKDLAAIDKYLLDNNIDALSDPDNLIRYILHDEGSGASPSLDNCVTTSYKGMLFNGSLFDQNNELSFPLRGVIFGWQVGIPLLNTGDSATLYIPSGLAYGSTPVGSIPANSNLIFNVRLKKIGTTYNANTGSCN